MLGQSFDSSASNVYSLSVPVKCNQKLQANIVAMLNFRCSNVITSNELPKHLSNKIPRCLQSMVKYYYAINEMLCIFLRDAHRPSPTDQLSVNSSNTPESRDRIFSIKSKLISVCWSKFISHYFILNSINSNQFSLKQNWC